MPMALDPACIILEKFAIAASRAGLVSVHVNGAGLVQLGLGLGLGLGLLLGLGLRVRLRVHTGHGENGD